MGIFNDLFSSGVFTTAQALVHEQWIRAKEKDEKEQMKAAQKLLDYYYRDLDEIRSHVKERAATVFTKDDINNMHWPIKNGVPRTVKRMALTFKYPPKLIPVDSSGEPSDLLQDKVDYMFRKMDTIQKLKELDRFSILMNTVLNEIVWRNGAVDWDLHLRSKTVVVEDPADYLNFTKVAYQFNPMDPDTLIPIKNGWVLWTEDEHIMIDGNGNQQGISNNDGTNPYDVIPITVVRQLEQDDFWGNLGSDLVDSTELAMIQLAGIWHTAYLQSFGIPVGTNLQTKPNKKVTIGPGQGFFSENVSMDMVKPALEFAKPEMDLEPVMNSIDRFKSWVEQDYGLPPSDSKLSSRRQSAQSKWMDNLEMLEDRENAITKWEDIIQEIFSKSVMVHNYHTPGRSHQIPEGTELKIEFPAAVYPETPSEKIERWTLSIANNLANPVDYYMQEKGMTEQEAIEAVEKNKKYNELYGMGGMPNFSAEDKGVKNPGGPDQGQMGG